MAEKRFAFQFAAGLATQVLTESKYIKAGYIVVDSIEERDKLTIKSDTNDGVIVEGTPVYVAGSVKTNYRYLGGKWVSEGAGGTFDVLKVNGTVVEVKDRVVDIEVPTKTSAITNDGNGVKVEGKDDPFITTAEANTAIAKAIKEYHQSDVIISKDAATTPKGVTWTDGTTEITGTLEAKDAKPTSVYYVKKTGIISDYYDEYKAIGDPAQWEMIGNTLVDISGKQDKLVAGSNITIENNSKGEPVINLAKKIGVLEEVTLQGSGSEQQTVITTGGGERFGIFNIETKGEDGSAEIQLKGSSSSYGTITLSGNVQIKSCEKVEIYNEDTSAYEQVATQNYIDEKFSYDATTKTLTIA